MYPPVGSFVGCMTLALSWQCNHMPASNERPGGSGSS